MNQKYRQWKVALSDPRVIAGFGLVTFFLIWIVMALLSHFAFSLMMYIKAQLIHAKSAGFNTGSVAQNFVPGNPLQNLFTLSHFFIPVVNPIFFVVFPLVGIVIWLFAIPKKMYEMRIAFRDLNKGSMGTARFTTVAELVTASVAVPLDDSEYEGKSGVPQMHIKPTEAQKLRLSVVPTRQITKSRSKVPFDAVARRNQQSQKMKIRHVPPKYGYDLVDRNNTNVAVVAGTQSGKTQLFTYAVLDLIMRAKEKASVVVTDLKGDMVRNTKAEFEQYGYEVKVFNLVTPEYSIAYNPLELIKEAYWAGEFDLAQQLSNTFSYALFHNSESKEPMWEESSIALTNALILAVCRVCKDNNTPERVTMYTVSVMLNELGTNPDEKGDTALDRFFNDLDVNDPAKLQYGTISFSQGITRSGIYTGTMAKLKSYTFSSIGRLTARNDLDIASLTTGDKPIALFIVYPDYDNSNYSLVATLLSQITFVLAKLATLSATSTLPRRVINLYEEIGNLPSISGLSEAMNVGLQRGLLYYLVFQSISQMKDKYGDKGARALLSACGNKYDILADDPDDAEYFAKLLGKKTIIATSRHGDPMSLDKSYGESEQGRDLMTAEELSRLREGEWVLVRGKQRRALNGERIKSRPIFANASEGHEMLFAYEYLNERFNHPQSFEALNDGHTADHALIDLHDLIIRKSEFGIAESEDEEVQQGKRSKRPEPEVYEAYRSDNVIVRVSKSQDGTVRQDIIDDYQRTAPDENDEEINKRDASNENATDSVSQNYRPQGDTEQSKAGPVLDPLDPNANFERNFTSLDEISDVIHEDKRKISDVLSDSLMTHVHQLTDDYLTTTQSKLFWSLDTFGEMQTFLLGQRDVNAKFYDNVKILFHLDEIQ